MTLYAANDLVNASTAALYVSDSGSPNVYLNISLDANRTSYILYLDKMVFQRRNSTSRIHSRGNGRNGKTSFQRVQRSAIRDSFDQPR